MLAWPPKYAREVLDYTVDFTARLAGDTIASATVTLPTPAGLVVGVISNTSTTVTVWLSGGTPTQAATALVAVVTAAGRTIDIEVQLYIQE